MGGQGVVGSRGWWGSGGQEVNRWWGQGVVGV